MQIQMTTLWYKQRDENVFVPLQPGRKRFLPGGKKKLPCRY